MVNKTFNCIHNLTFAIRGTKEKLATRLPCNCLLFASEYKWQGEPEEGFLFFCQSVMLIVYPLKLNSIANEKVNREGSGRIFPQYPILTNN